MRLRVSVGVLTGLLVIAATAGPARAACGDTGVSLQVLGSAGPFGGGRASAGYLVWVDGVSRIMVDAGGGTFVRFHEAGATLADLDLLALSHFHPDHVSDVPALLWPRGGTLRVAGPSGSPEFPSVDDFLQGLFGSDGVFRILNSRVTFDPVTVDVEAGEPTTVLSAGRIRVRGRGVPHWTVPAVGYRAAATRTDRTRRSRISCGMSTCSSCTSPGQRPRAERRPTCTRCPSVWGQMATDARVGRLVLSHVSANQNVDENVAHLRSRYQGPLTIASDSLCLDVE